MSETASCQYCDNHELMAKVGVEIAVLSVSKLYLFREQSHPGRVIVAYNGHVDDLTDLSDSERNAFFADVAKASRAIKKAFSPAKINYAAYGDLVRHLHFHLVPKYRDDFEWGGTFVMNPEKRILSDEECRPVIDKIRAALRVEI